MWVGEPGLDAKRRDERHAIVRNAINAYRFLPDVAHGRIGDPFLSTSEVSNLERAVALLEESLVSPAGGGADL